MRYVDFEKLHFVQRKEAFRSKNLSKLIKSDYHKIPLLDLLDGLFEEISLIEGLLKEKENELEITTNHYQKIIKSLLLIKEQFDRKQEVFEIETKMRQTYIENRSLEKQVIFFNLFFFFRTNLLFPD